MSRKPVIFIAFANDRVDNAAYLRNLPKEQAGIRQSLERARQAGLCDVVERNNATVKQIIDVFQSAEYRDRIAAFHYGGHANGYQLLLETTSGEHASAHSSGLVPFLAGQQGLKLVFLNGCSSQQQAHDLLRAGISSVIGTSQSINDDIATQLAIRFYTGLGEGLSIEKAWTAAEDEVKIEKGTANMRDLFWEEADTAAVEHFPWEIRFRLGAEVVRNWNLPEAVDNPLFGLPPVPPTYHLPETPYLYLQRYQRPQAEVFFGRSYYIRALYNLVTDEQAPPLILLYGQSGVGKSSLIDAGFKPRLERSHHIWYLRRDQGISVPELFEQAANMREDLLHQASSEEMDEEAIAEEQATRLNEFHQRLEDLGDSYMEDLPEEMRELLYRATLELRASKDFHLLGQKQPFRRRKGIVRNTPRKTAINPAQKAEDMPLLDQWLYLEEITGKPLVIIVDQLESIFTMPDPNLPTEFEDLVQDIKTLFGNPSRLPKGKLILSYRKEYNPEIEERFKEVQIPRSRLFLKHLERKDIVEVVTGLARQERTRLHYKLSVEEELPTIIADDLLEDKESPIAPVLQILLTKLWQVSETDDDGARRFTVDGYQNLRKDGILMDDFYEQQMEALAKWNPEVVRSGLALDVMMFHSSSLMTADLRNQSELYQEYGENLDILPPLLDKLMELYLLSGIQVGDEQRTTLAHDTLAPVVFMQYRSSDFPGQRARRILENKAASFNPEDKQSTLDEADLAIVEGGHYGMRAWTEQEKELVDMSRERRRRVQRARERRRRLAILAVVLIAGLGIFAATEAYRAKTEKEKAEKQRQRAEESAEAAKIAETKAQEEARAARIAEAEARKQKNIADDEREAAQIAEKQAEEEAARARKAEQQAEEEAQRAEVASQIAKQQEEKAIQSAEIAENRRLEAEAQKQRAIRNREIADSLSNIAITKALALKSINVNTRDYASEISGILALKSYRDIQKFGGSQQDKDIYQALRAAWDRLSINKGGVDADQGEIEMMRKSPDQQFLVSAGTEGIIKFWDLQQQPMEEGKNLVFCQSNRCYITDMNFSPDGRWLASSHTDNLVRLWEIDKSRRKEKSVSDYIIKKSIDLEAHKSRPIAAIFYENELLVSLDQKGDMHYWNINRYIKPEKSISLGSNITAAVKHPTEPVIVIALEDNSLHLFNIQDATLEPWIPKFLLIGAVTEMSFDATGDKLAVGMLNGGVALFKYDASSNDPNRAYLNEWQGHLSGVTALRFSPNGQELATSSYDKTVKLYKVNELIGSQVEPTPIIDIPHDYWVKSVDFMLGGKQLIFGGSNRSMSIYDTDIVELAQKIRSRLKSELAEKAKRDEVTAVLTSFMKGEDDYRKIVEDAIK